MNEDICQLQQEIELMKLDIQLLSNQLAMTELLREMSFVLFMMPIAEYLEDVGKNSPGQFQDHFEFASTEVKRLQVEIARLQQILSTRKK